jgi:hypothetical protein
VSIYFLICTYNISDADFSIVTITFTKVQLPVKNCAGKWQRDGVCGAMGETNPCEYTDIYRYTQSAQSGGVHCDYFINEQRTTPCENSVIFESDGTSSSTFYETGTWRKLKKHKCTGDPGNIDIDDQWEDCPECDPEIHHLNTPHTPHNPHTDPNGVLHLPTIVPLLPCMHAFHAPCISTDGSPTAPPVPSVGRWSPLRALARNLDHEFLASLDSPPRLERATSTTSS